LGKSAITEKFESIDIDAISVGNMPSWITDSDFREMLEIEIS
jgi:hypothetical protein